MVDSGVGRTERAEPVDGRLKSGTLAKADDGEMRKPRPRLTAEDSERLQPLLKPLCERGCPPALVIEDEHADAAGLAVAHRGEHGTAPGVLDRDPERLCDRLELPRGPRAEEREGDVQVPARDDAPCEMRRLP